MVPNQPSAQPEEEIGELWSHYLNRIHYNLSASFQHTKKNIFPNLLLFWICQGGKESKILLELYIGY